MNGLLNFIYIPVVHFLSLKIDCLGVRIVLWTQYYSIYLYLLLYVLSSMM